MHSLRSIHYCPSVCPYASATACAVLSSRMMSISLRTHSTISGTGWHMVLPSMFASLRFHLAVSGTDIACGGTSHAYHPPRILRAHSAVCGTDTAFGGSRQQEPAVLT
eukprot:2543191-Rhodomonas_salina.1